MQSSIKSARKIRLRIHNEISRIPTRIPRNANNPLIPPTFILYITFVAVGTARRKTEKTQLRFFRINTHHFPVWIRTNTVIKRRRTKRGRFSKARRVFRRKITIHFPKFIESTNTLKKSHHRRLYEKPSKTQQKRTDDVMSLNRRGLVCP